MGDLSPHTSAVLGLPVCRPLVDLWTQSHHKQDHRQLFLNFKSRQDLNWGLNLLIMNTHWETD